MPVFAPIFWLCLLWILAPLAFPLSHRLWGASPVAPELVERNASLQNGVLGFLPDGGWACGRVLMLALWTLAVFWAGNLGVPVRFAPVFLGVFAVVSLWFWKRDRVQLGKFLRRQWRSIVIVEAVFVVVFAVFFGLRCLWPDTGNGEKPMDIALIAACARANFLPPPNPYLAGARLGGYYYLGHLQSAMLSNTSAVPARWSYNLMAATLPALCFALAVSLCAAITGRWKRGAMASLFVLALGTLEPLRQWLEPNDAGERSWPFGAKVVDYFSTSRVIPNPINATSGINYTINEYPWFTFTYGDLHAHFFAMPLALLTLCLGWSLWGRVQGGAEGVQVLAPRDLQWRAGLCGFVIAALLITNTWDVPAYWLFLAFCLWPSRAPKARVCEAVLSKSAAKKARRAALPAAIVASTPASISRWRSFALPLAILCGATILGALFYLTRLHTNANQPTPLDLPATPFLAWLLMWGVIFSAWLLALADDARRDESFRIQSLRPLLLPLLLWAILKFGPAWTWQWTWPRASQDGSRFLITYTNGDYSVPLIIASLLVASWWRALRSPDRVFALLCRMACCGLVALLWSEGTWAGFLGPAIDPLTHRLSGPTFHRQDTTFKFGLQGWYLIGLAAACAVLKALPQSNHKPNDEASPTPASTCLALWRRWPLLLRFGFGVALTIMALSTYACLDGRSRHFNEEARARGESPWQSPDAWAHLEPPEREAAQWLQSQARDGDTLLEAEQKEGGDYSPYSRYTHATGISSVVGPSAHTFQWGHDKQNIDQMWREISERKQDVRNFYTLNQAAARNAVIKKYGVRFVVVGELERQEYGELNADRLGAIYPNARFFGDALDPHRVLVIQIP